MFTFKKSKKELDITDAINRKKATITIGGKPVVIEAFKLSKALELINIVGKMPDLIKLATADLPAFNRLLLANLPQVLAFCVPNAKDINADDITLTEFADLILAVWAVNDMERIVSNFTTAVQSIPKATQVLDSSPKS